MPKTLKISTPIALIFVLIFIISCNKRKKNFEYFGQSKPVSFAKPFNTDKEYLKKGFLIDPQGEYVIFSGKTGKKWYHSKLMFIKKQNDKWSAPGTLSFSKKYYCIEPNFSPDGNTLLFSSNRTSESKKDKTLSIWKSDRTKDGWSEPTQLDTTKINFNDWTLGAQWTENNNLYFLTRKPGHPYSFYVAHWNGDSFSNPKPLDIPIHTTSIYTTWNILISSDESYMIFPSERPGSYAGQNPYKRMDLFISFNKNNRWTNPKPMHSLNNSGLDYPVTISPDKQYFFYNSNDTLHWCKTTTIDSLKSQNFTPYLQKKLPDFKIDLNRTTKISLPTDYFIDDDFDSLEFEITQNNGNKLPNWITFNKENNSLSCTPMQSESIVLNIKAKEPYGNYTNEKICITTSDKSTQLVKGLNFNFYDDSIESIEEFKNFKPKFIGTSRSMRPYHQETNQNFGISYEGFIYIPQNGDYTFDFMMPKTSNLKLDINQIEILNNNKRKNTISLKKGLTPLLLMATFKNKENWFLPQMEGLGIPKNIINSNLLFSRVK